MTATTRRSAAGWLATALGGTVGGVALGAVGFGLAVAYYDSVKPDAGLEALAGMFLCTAAGIYLGLVCGSIVALRLRGYQRRVPTGLVFATLATMSLIGWGAFGQEFLPEWDEGVILILALATVIPGSAWATRWLVGPRASGEPPPDRSPST